MINCLGARLAAWILPGVRHGDDGIGLAMDHEQIVEAAETAPPDRTGTLSAYKHRGPVERTGFDPPRPAVNGCRWARPA
jgi:hypothetical protein